jgi:integrase
VDFGRPLDAHRIYKRTQDLQRDITDAWLRSVKPPPKGNRLLVWDTRQPLLLLRLTAGGTATWSVRVRTRDGKRTQPTLGRWPALGIAAARKRALAVLADIHAGGDPVAERRAAEAERVARLNLPTVTDRLAQWQEARQDRWAPGYAQSVRRTCDKEIIPHLGARPLAETTRADWTDLITRKRRKYASSAAGLYRIAAAFLGHAEAAGWIALPLLPRKGAAVLAPPVAARARTLTDSELAAIWRAADSMAPKSRAFVHLLAMTAARRQEVADIAIGEIDLTCATWTVPASRAKNAVAYTVPLHSLLLTDLKAIWPSHDPGPAWKLLGAIKGSGLSGFSKIKVRLDSLSGISDWHIHDLRRTARTDMARLGVSSEHAELALNHISGRSALVRIYDRHDYSTEVLAALGRWQAHVAALATDAPQRAEVVALRRRV